jgi:hypothetical protein
MNCNDTTQLFSDYYDGGLLPAERQALEEHLRTCSPCTGEFKVYREGLDALHETRPLETTDIFLPSVRAAAQAHLTRKESILRPPAAAGEPPAVRSGFSENTTTEALTVRTPTVSAPPRAPIPTWVPWALAATIVVSFTLGWIAFGRGRSGEVEVLERRNAELQAALAKRKAPPERIVEAPVDKEKILREQGLEKDESGRWIPREFLQAFRENKVVIEGRTVTREEAALALVKSQPPAPQKAPETVVTPAPDPEKAVAEAMAGAGYRRFNSVWFPESWVSRLEAGDVLVGVDQWRKASDFKEDLIRDHGLVEDPRTKKLMTREQSEWIASSQHVRRPDASPAVNEITAVLEGLQIGAPMNYRGLTLYPLLPQAPPAAVTYMTLNTAQGPGTVELLDSSVFSAQVKNPLDAEILFLAGEILTGGRCARVVTEDTLAPRKETGRVPVLCVEPGAWRAGDKYAKESGHYLAPPSLRRALVWEQGQGALWSLLSRRLDKTRSGQPDLFKKHAEALADYRAYFTVLAEREPSSIGLAVAEGDTLECVELFQDHTLFAGFLDRMVAAAGLDLLERGSEAVIRGPGLFPNSVKGVKHFLESAFFWTYESRDEGYGIRKDEGWIGRAHVSGGTVNHVLLFTPGAPEWDRRAAYPVPRDKISKALSETEARLKGLGPARKAAAFRDVASINSPDVTALLARHLGETDPTVRRAVIQELGATGDPRAAEPLLLLLPKSRQDVPLFAELVRALARLGDEHAVEPFLRQLDQGDPELARVIIGGMPELLLQLRTRDVLERATARLVQLYEASEGMVKGDVVFDPVMKNVKAADAPLMLDLIRASIRQLIGREFSSAPACRAWWNDRETRDKFLKERTGK